MFFDLKTFSDRRAALVEQIKATHNIQTGAVLLFAGLEQERTRFRQDSTFYYFTGIEEPGVALWLTLDGHATIYIPNFVTPRSVWVKSSVQVIQEAPARLGVDAIDYLGQPCEGYQLYPFFTARGHEQLLKKLGAATVEKLPLFTINPPTSYGSVEQRQILQRLVFFLPEIAAQFLDISPIVARLRRKKDKKEIEALYKAIDITLLAQEGAQQATAPGKFEYQVQAALEYVMMEAGGHGQSFPSIVAGGINGTILHYTENRDKLNPNELLVVDIGAEWNYYCADITRTYPISGKFTARQQELYDLVLETQKLVADNAKPGMWLSHPDHPEQSLNHIARNFLKKQGYDKYFPHGIGHFLGLDVHDVGDSREPLQAGDVITIEPGIYIPEEKIGIRIEDNYWIVDGGSVCLSE